MYGVRKSKSWIRPCVSVFNLRMRVCLSINLSVLLYVLHMYRQMHQCESIFIGKIVMNNQVKSNSKANLCTILTCDISDPERLITIRL